MNIQHFIKSAKKRSVWSLGNQVLYDLCKKCPEHKCRDQIIAKIWLIGRSYAAAIERRRKNSKIENDRFYEEVVVDSIIKSKLDLKLKRLKHYTKINKESMNLIFDAHKYLIDIFKNITGLEKRSLASKYLHFHLPHLFYIYDSRAVEALRKLLKSKKVKLPQCKLDKEYATFFIKLHNLRQDIIEKTNQYLTPRQIDKALLEY